MAFASDFGVLVEGAGINLAFAGIALSCDTGSSWPRSPAWSARPGRELLMLPRTIPSDECLALGLVTRVVPADQFERSSGSSPAALSGRA